MALLILKQFNKHITSSSLFFCVLCQVWCARAPQSSPQNMASFSDECLNFASMTGASLETANYYLEASGGVVESAVSLFFEMGGAPAPSAFDDTGDDAALDPSSQGSSKDAEGNEVVHASPTPTFTVQAPTSQFDLPEGRSACTTIACEAAFRMTAEKEALNAATFEDVSAIVSYIADGVAEYKTINANAPVEHMGCGEVMLMSAKYSKIMEQVVMVQGSTQGSKAFEEELENALAGAQEDKAPVCAVITKPPESVVVYCHQSGVFVLFDSHPRQILGINGAYACGFATAASCAAFLRGIFPAVSGLGDSMMAQMYNSFEFTVLRRL